MSWDLYAQATRPSGAAPWFEWVDGCGEPGRDVFGPVEGKRAVELGCGTARNAAALAELGSHVTGLDSSPAAIGLAREGWGHLSTLTLVEADAVEWLTSSRDTFTVAYSVFGAAWFTDPRKLLPAVARCLEPGGVFAFSQMDAEAPYGRNALTAAPRVHRWDYPREAWTELLATSGFSNVRSRTLPAAPAFGRPTVLITATRQ